MDVYMGGGIGSWPGIIGKHADLSLVWPLPVIKLWLHFFLSFFYPWGGLSLWRLASLFVNGGGGWKTVDSFSLTAASHWCSPPSTLTATFALLSP